MTYDTCTYHTSKSHKYIGVNVKALQLHAVRSNSRENPYQYCKSHENLYQYYKSHENPYQVL